MTGSTVSLGVESSKSLSESGAGQTNVSPVRRSSNLRGETRSTLRMSDRTWESRRIKEEMQEILSPTPLELHKVRSWHTGLSILASVLQPPGHSCFILWLIRSSTMTLPWPLSLGRIKMHRVSFSGDRNKGSWTGRLRFQCIGRFRGERRVREHDQTRGSGWSSWTQTVRPDPSGTHISTMLR